MQCRDTIKVIEIPLLFIDQERFRCHLCLSGVPALFRDDLGVPRTEIRPYDPDMSAMPEGF